MTAIAFKVFVAVACGLLGARLLKSPALDGWSERGFIWRIAALQLALGLGLFAALYVLGNAQITSDVPAYYLPAARSALSGKLAYRDFSTSYSPLFPYLGACLVALWNSGKVFALFAILVGVVALLLWHLAAHACFGRELARRASVLYATSGHVLVQSLLGTNQIWIACLLGGSVLLLVRGRELGSGVTQALALCATKFLAVLFWPMLWIGAARRGRWLGGAALLSGLCFALFAACGADPLEPLHAEGDLISSGNLPYLLGPVTLLGGASRQLVLRLFDGATIAALSIVAAWIYWRTRALPPLRRPPTLFAAIGLVAAVFLIASKKSFTGYAIFALYPMITVAVGAFARTGVLVGFLLVLNVLLAVEPSVWFYLHGEGLGLDEWMRRSGLARVGPLVVLDLALIACYLLIARQSLRALARVTAEDGGRQSRSSSAAELVRSVSVGQG